MNFSITVEQPILSETTADYLKHVLIFWILFEKLINFCCFFVCSSSLGSVGSWLSGSKFCTPDILVHFLNPVRVKNIGVKLLRAYFTIDWLQHQKIPDFKHRGHFSVFKQHCNVFKPVFLMSENDIVMSC